MAVNLRVIGHFEQSGKVLTHFGSGIQFNVSIAGVQTQSTDWSQMPDPGQINTALSNNGKLPSGAVFVLEGYANLDKEHNAGILS